MEHIININKHEGLNNLQEIKVDNIPLCNSCLFEIKPGNYLCTSCKANLCEQHIEKHKTHNIIKLIK